MNTGTFKQVVNDEDFVAVAELARRIWTEHYVPIIGQSQVDYMLATFQSERAIREQIRDGYGYYLILHDDKPSGYLAVVQNGGPGRMLLSKIYISKELRGGGLGCAALAFAEECARHTGADTLWLTVNRNNAGSIAWYERRGFSIIMTQITDIGGGYVMDDYVMEKAIGRN